jgi:hypothetical protein
MANRSGAQVAILLTDGENDVRRGLSPDSYLSIDAASAVNSVRQKGIIFYTIGYDLDRMKATKPGKYEEAVSFLRQLAYSTRGNFYPSRVEGLRDIFSQIQEIITSDYEIRVQSNLPPKVTPYNYGIMGERIKGPNPSILLAITSSKESHSVYGTSRMYFFIVAFMVLLLIYLAFNRLELATASPKRAKAKPPSGKEGSVVPPDRSPDEPRGWKYPSESDGRIKKIRQ